MLSQRGTVISTPRKNDSLGSTGRTLLTVSSVIIMSPSYEIIWIILCDRRLLIVQNIRYLDAYQNRLSVIKDFAITTGNTTMHICLVSQRTVICAWWCRWTKSRLLHLTAIVHIKNISTKIKYRAFRSRQVKWVDCSLAYSGLHGLVSNSV